MSQIVDQLTDGEDAELQQHEEAIEAAYKVFWQVIGGSLKIIREKRLYRAQYPTFEDYCQARWGFSASRARQLIGGTETYQYVSEAVNIPLPNEAVSRSLGSLPQEVQPQVAVAAYEQAQSAGRVMTSGDVRAAAQSVTGVTPPAPLQEDDPLRRQVYATQCGPIIKQMNDGTLAPGHALALWDTLQSCLPQVRGDMLQLGITNSTLIREMNRLFRQGRESYGEIVATRHLQMIERSVPITSAKPVDLGLYLEEKSAEHRRRCAVERDAAQGIVAVQLTLWLNNPERSADVLCSMLGEKQALEVARRVVAGGSRKARVGKRKGGGVYAAYH